MDDLLGRLVEAWGPNVARLGELVELADCELIASHGDDGEILGILGYVVRGGSLEVVAINSFAEGRGVGRELMNEARQIAVDRGCTRLWLITTNDNIRAIAFYEAWGMSRVAEHLGAVDGSRASLKPTIPTHGANGAPIRDEFEYELRLEVGD